MSKTFCQRVTAAHRNEAGIYRKTLQEAEALGESLMDAALMQLVCHSVRINAMADVILPPDATCGTCPICCGSGVCEAANYPGSILGCDACSGVGWVVKETPGANRAAVEGMN